jgi:hypothetical protein
MFNQGFAQAIEAGMGSFQPHGTVIIFQCLCGLWAKTAKDGQAGIWFKHNVLRLLNIGKCGR